MNKRRLKTKKRTLPSKVDTTKKIEKQARKNVSETNQRIKSIEKKYKNCEFTWGITKLKNMLGNYFKKGKIVIPKQPSLIELLDITKETKKFLDSKYSTKKGIEEIKRKAKQGIKENLSAEDKDITDEDIEDYVSMFYDNDFTSFLNATGMKASEVWDILDEAKENNDSEDRFLNRLSMYTTIVDEDIRNKAIRLYNKYVR